MADNKGQVITMLILMILCVMLGFVIGNDGEFLAQETTVSANQIQPTKSEFDEFLKSDKTDEIEYDKETFNCEKFTERFLENAKETGYCCFAVSIKYLGDDVGHSIVGVMTSDEGLLFVEPQSDKYFDIYPGAEFDGQIVKEVVLGD
jgi:hypothetical protein